MLTSLCPAQSRTSNWLMPGNIASQLTPLARRPWKVMGRLVSVCSCRSAQPEISAILGLSHLRRAKGWMLWDAAALHNCEAGKLRVLSAWSYRIGRMRTRALVWSTVTRAPWSNSAAKRRSASSTSGPCHKRFVTW